MITTINIKYPTSWDEVGKRELKIISSVLLLKLSRQEILFMLFCRLSGIRLLHIPGTDEGTPESVYTFKKGWKKFRMQTYIVAQACKELHYILDDFGLPECPISGIDTKLYDVKFKDYFFADALFSRFRISQNRTFLKASVKILAGKRMVISTKLLNAYVIWFTGVQHYIKESYPNIFTDSDGADIEKNSADMLHDILSAMNKDEPQNDTKILDADVHSVFHSLDNIYFKLKHDNKGIS